MPIAVNEPCAEVAHMRISWAVLDALNGGTPTMRLAGKALLPQWPAEDIDSYRMRLSTATLFPAWKRTVNVMSGKPFAKPLDLVKAPASIEAIADDIDLQGVSLHSFAAEMFAESIGFGLAGILVDYPRADNAGMTQQQVEAQGMRPYWIRVKHNNIIGWQAQRAGGKMKLMQLRLLETYSEADGAFSSVWKPQVRVLTPGAWEIWRDTGAGNWGMAESGETTLHDIPFVPLYGWREDFMVGRPPLEDLAFLNVKHWQSQSDQDTILHIARVPILAMIGADDQSTLAVGAKAAVRLPMGAELKYVEHSGHAIAAGESALLTLEQQMIQTGAELLVKQPGSQRTATESQTDAEANKSDLQRMAENFEDALDQALYYTAQFLHLPTGGNVKLYADYGTGTLGEASAALIKDLHLSGLVSAETAITELQRRGVLSDDIDPQEELAKIEAEGPAPGEITQPDTLGAGADTQAVGDGG